MASIDEKLRRAVVGVAGLGGLGSNVAAALARAGVGRLIIADFDMVEAANLNRQQYFLDQVGRPKVECTVENLRRINPAVLVEAHNERLTAANVPELFAAADVVAECFDRAQEKQMIVETVLARMSPKPIVSVSGLAGYGKSNAITTRRISPRLILIGDGQSGIDTEPILTAARVGIAASHQANAIIELLVDEIKASAP
ncbi:MAG: sulfur carrier protein ThiS adenylyltransferase ThiF [Phycisphaerales bacterium]|nr:MAG: sulfur carrier protein ThiS adenylyltransferase ThiF [Phycisphaerales bacterium]